MNGSCHMTHDSLKCVPWLGHTYAALQTHCNNCNSLQLIATYFNTHMNQSCVLWLSLTRIPSAKVQDTTHCNTLQHTATHCNTLQHTATHCNTLQRIATHCNTLQRTATHCNTLQHTATHCNTLQHTAWNTLQRTALHCDTMQHTAAHFNTLQHWSYAQAPSHPCSVLTNVCHGSFIWGPWLIHMRTMTHACVRAGVTNVCHDPFTCGPWLIFVQWLICICAMTHASAQARAPTRQCSIHASMWYDSFICVPWLISTWAKTHCYDSCIYTGGSTSSSMFSAQICAAKDFVCALWHLDDAGSCVAACCSFL